jgi:hypothetical protein
MWVSRRGKELKRKDEEKINDVPFPPNESESEGSQSHHPQQTQPGTNNQARTPTVMLWIEAAVKQKRSASVLQEPTMVGFLNRIHSKEWFVGGAVFPVFFGHASLPKWGIHNKIW